MLLGEIDGRAGQGLAVVIVKNRVLEVPPPGAGVKTVTLAVGRVIDPGILAMSAARMVAVSLVALTKVVVRLLPFHCTTDAGTKPLPVTVRVKAGPFCGALLGASVESTGTGLPAVTMKDRALEVPPPGAGVTTVTWAVPAATRSLAGMAALSWVALTNVVVRLLPFQRTVEADTKPLPVTVRVKAGPPCKAVLGASVESTGTGLPAVIVKDRALEVPPPGAGVNTVTCAVPAAARSLAGMAALSWVALTNVVVRPPPFQRTVEADTKPLPVTVRVKAGPPWSALLGASVESTGTGLPAVTVKGKALEVLPPMLPGADVNTVTCAVPAAARSLAGMAALS